jgi:hypothetical protein
VIVQVQQTAVMHVSVFPVSTVFIPQEIPHSGSMTIDLQLPDSPFFPGTTLLRWWKKLNKNVKEFKKEGNSMYEFGKVT